MTGSEKWSKDSLLWGQSHVSSVLFNTAVDLAGAPWRSNEYCLCYFMLFSWWHSGMYAIVWWVEVVFVAAAVVSISLVPAADPAPLSLSDRVTRWHFIAAVIR